MSDGTDVVELPVWIGGCEKWVTGLTKRTTCDDIIYALLQHDTNPNEDFDVSCFCIFERWRDVERPLRGRTKILKIWKAWGDECRNVRLSVQKVEVPLDTSSEVSKTRRSRRHYSTRDRRGREKTRGRSSCGSSSCNNVVRKDYGPIDGVGITDDHYKAQAFHELVQIVIEQEKKIQEQLTRIRDTDSQIESYETKMHELRMRENGQNYVQDAYLRDKSDDSSGGEELFPAIKANDLEAYMHICENILEIENKISHEQSRVLNLSQRVQEESILEPPPTPPRSLHHPPPPPVGCLDGSRSGPLASVPEDHIQEEIERLKNDLIRSQALTDAQQHQLQLVEMTMKEMDSQLTHKSDFINKSIYELNIAENASMPPTGSDVGYNFSPKDRHSSSTSGVSEVSEMEGSDRSTSRSRVGESRSRERSRDQPHNREKSRERSVSTSSARGRSGSASLREKQNFSRERLGSFTKVKQQTMCYNVPQGRTISHPSLSEPPHQEEYYVTRAYYPPPSSYQENYLNVNTKNISDDSNSDTGLSSLHSDEAPPILETLV